MTREEAMKQLHTFICNYNLDECSNVAILTSLINEIYNDFENKMCKNCKYFEKDQYGIYCKIATGEDRCLEIYEEFGCNRFERRKKWEKLGLKVSQ